MLPHATRLMQGLVHILAWHEKENITILVRLQDVVWMQFVHPYVIFPEVSKQAEGDEVSVRAQKGAVRLLYLAVLEQNGILGEQAQRHSVHQKHRQAELMGQSQELFQ